MSSEEGTPTVDSVASRELLSPREIAAVLDQYQLGVLESIRPFSAGSSRAPKAKITTGSGVFLLKRLAPPRSDLDGMKFQHRLLQHLTGAGFPVAELQISSDNQTMVSHGEYHYEISRWVNGHRYRFTPAAAKASGAAMAAMHDLLVSMTEQAPPRRGYHDRPDVAKAAAKLAQESDSDVRCGFERLADHLRAARRDVREYWPRLPLTVAHGDWHPGNILLGDDRVVAVIDFESARAEPRLADFSNGLLQFSLNRQAGTPVSEWPVACDMELLGAMAAGFQLVARQRLDDTELHCVPSLMIEALATEIIITLRRKGQIRKLGPEVVLPWVIARLDWIVDHRQAVIDVVAGT